MNPAIRALAAGVLLLAISAAPTVSAKTKGTIEVVSPKPGEKITSTDIPVEVKVNNFKLSKLNAGLPDVADEGHVHVMIDGMTMGVLFNFYAEPKFTLLGDGIKPGKHKLIFDLATNNHLDQEETVKEVEIDYQPTSPRALPTAPANLSGPPTVKIVSPAEGATVGPKFRVKVDKTSFVPSEGAEGKPNIKGVGHYHVFVDMDMSMMMPMPTPAAGAAPAHEMMAMDGMVLMPGTDEFEIDLTAWPNGKHTLVVEPVQNDHTAIEGAKEAMITFALQGAAASGPPPMVHGAGAAAPAGGTLPKSGGFPYETLQYGLGAAIGLAGTGVALLRRRGR